MRAVPLFLLILTTTSCRGVPESESEYFPEDVDGFEASLPDGGEPEPVAACLDGSPRFDNNFSPFHGGESSVAVEVVHFSSFYCSHCADFAAYSSGLWRNRADFQEGARIYFHHASYKFRHRAAVAALNQGENNFWKLHDYIFGGLLLDAAITEEEIVDYVNNRLGLDMEQFNADLESEETYAFLEWDMKQGANAGVNATPTVFVCGEKIKWLELEDEVSDAF